MDKLTYMSQNLWIFLISFYSYVFLIFIMFINFINIKKIKISIFNIVITNFLSLVFIINLSAFYKKNLI